MGVFLDFDLDSSRINGIQLYCLKQEKAERKDKQGLL